MSEINIVGILSWVSDMMLAIAALYVSGQAMRGYYYEFKAQRQADPVVKANLLENAKTLYAFTSLSRPWVLITIVVGALIKVGLGACQAIEALPPA